jgi:hypothetical protein
MLAYMLKIVNCELEDPASDERMKNCLLKELEYSILYAGKLKVQFVFYFDVLN